MCLLAGMSGHGIQISSPNQIGPVGRYDNVIPGYKALQRKKLLEGRATTKKTPLVSANALLLLEIAAAQAQTWKVLTACPCGYCCRRKCIGM